MENHPQSRKPFGGKCVPKSRKYCADFVGVNRGWYQTRVQGFINGPMRLQATRGECLLGIE